MRESNIVPQEIQSITTIVLARDTNARGIKKVFPPRILAFKNRRSLRGQPDRGIGKEEISRRDDLIAVRFALQTSDPMSGLYSLQFT